MLQYTRLDYQTFAHNKIKKR